MKKVSDFLRGEAAGWQKWEIIWMIFCLAATGLLSYLLNDTLPGIIAAQTALLYTLLAGKGTISCYLFGIVNTVLYGWLSWQNRLYGEVMLNWGWYLPMMFTGLFCWRRHLDDSCANDASPTGPGCTCCYSPRRGSLSMPSFSGGSTIRVRGWTVSPRSFPLPP